MTPRVCVRTCARYDLDEGFELIRVMESDLVGAAQSKAYDAMIITSMDDRLALTIERIKSLGVLVIGCRSGNEEADRRMLRLFDDLETRSDDRMGEGQQHEVAMSEETLTTIRDAIDRWLKDSDNFTRDRTIGFARSRSWLPRPMDSQSLFLTNYLFGRDLTEGEKNTMRHEFRVALQ